MRKTGRPKLAGAAQVEGGNPKEGYGPPKTAQANGRFGVEFPVGSCREALGLLAIARGVVGPGEIRHNGGPGLRISFLSPHPESTHESTCRRKRKTAAAPARAWAWAPAEEAPAARAAELPRALP